MSKFWFVLRLNVPFCHMFRCSVRVCGLRLIQNRTSDKLHWKKSQFLCFPLRNQLVLLDLVTNGLTVRLK